MYAESDLRLRSLRRTRAGTARSVTNPECECGHLDDRLAAPSLEGLEESSPTT